MNEIDKYIENVEESRKIPFQQLRKIIAENLPQGFTEEMSYGLPSWVITLEDYPAGYHCKKDTALPFLSIASQKNFIALYHMGLYAHKELLDWFIEEYPKHSKRKLDMGKSCIRFKKVEEIPYELIAELCQKMTPENWIDIYENQLKK